MVFVFVGNIPQTYRSKDLRNFFSEYTECKAFICFHFRHRKINESILKMIENNKDRSKLDKTTLCSFCEIKNGFFEKFITKYYDAIWYNFENEYEYSKKVVLSLINSVNIVDELKAYIEFNPPKMLPQGNVGTPLEFFKQHINNCRMPVDIIKRLGICSSLLMNRSTNIYANVSLDYVETFGESNILGNNKQPRETSLKNLSLNLYHNKSDKESDTEEWDRYEALYNDVDEQQRTKPRLYEQPMEVVWEKGGSGLVFHTDDVTWKELEGKMDFDEDTADDWDIDTEIYSANKTNVDELMEKTPEGKLLKLKIMQRLKKGTPQAQLEQPSSFKISKFATNQMKKYGWKHGDSLGKNNTGIKSAISADYRRPDDKSGLGVNSEDNDFDEIALSNYLYMRKFNKPKKHFIASKYDQPSNSEPKSSNTNPWKSASPNHMKYNEEK